MKIQLSERAQQTPSGGQGREEEGLCSDNVDDVLKVLLNDVGAEIRFEDGNPVLRFLRPLARMEVEPERWAKAEELEGLFWKWAEAREPAQFDR